LTPVDLKHDTEVSVRVHRSRSRVQRVIVMNGTNTISGRKFSGLGSLR
jgi:hypothetical protein